MHFANRVHLFRNIPFSGSILRLAEASFASLAASIRRWHGITILRLDEMAALWFPRISRMRIHTTNLVWCFEDDHLRLLAGFEKQLHVIGGAFLRVENR